MPRARDAGGPEGRASGAGEATSDGSGPTNAPDAGRPKPLTEDADDRPPHPADLASPWEDAPSGHTAGPSAERSTPGSGRVDRTIDRSADRSPERRAAHAGEAAVGPAGTDPLATVREVFPGRLLGFTPTPSGSDAEGDAEAEPNGGLFEVPDDDEANVEPDLEEA